MWRVIDGINVVALWSRGPTRLSIDRWKSLLRNLTRGNAWWTATRMACTRDVEGYWLSRAVLIEGMFPMAKINEKRVPNYNPRMWSLGMTYFRSIYMSRMYLIHACFGLQNWCSGALSMCIVIWKSLEASSKVACIKPTVIICFLILAAVKVSLMRPFRVYQFL